MVARLKGFVLLLALWAPAAAADDACPPTTERLAALATTLVLPPAAEAFAHTPTPAQERLIQFFEAHTGEVVLLDLRVRLAEPPSEPACAGNLTSPEAGELLLRLGANRLLVLERDPAVRTTFCQPTLEGFRYAGPVFVEPPPPLASLESWTLREVPVDALTLSQSRRCLGAQEAAPR